MDRAGTLGISKSLGRKKKSYHGVGGDGDYDQLSGDPGNDAGGCDEKKILMNQVNMREIDRVMAKLALDRNCPLSVVELGDLCKLEAQRRATRDGLGNFLTAERAALREAGRNKGSEGKTILKKTHRDISAQRSNLLGRIGKKNQGGELREYNTDVLNRLRFLKFIIQEDISGDTRTKTQLESIIEKKLMNKVQDPLTSKSVIQNIELDATAEKKLKVRNFSNSDYPGGNVSSPLKKMKLRDKAVIWNH